MWLIVLSGCVTTPTGEPTTRVISETRTPNVSVVSGPASVPKEPEKPQLTPDQRREAELTEVVDGERLRSLAPEEQALARALALREIAALRLKRGEHDGAEDAIERAVREARASGDAKLHREIFAERVRISRAGAMARSDHGDYAAALKQLDALMLVPELTLEQKREITSDRFLVTERRAEAQEKNAAQNLPGEVEVVDTKTVLAEVDRVFGPLSQFGNAEVDGAPVQDPTKNVGFQLDDRSSGATLSIVTTPRPTLTAEKEPEQPKAMSSETRGHDRAMNDRVTVDLTSSVGSKGQTGPAVEELPTAALPKASDAPLVETGRFDQRTVFAMVSLHKSSVTRCYERSIRSGEKVTGKLEVRITVQPTGVVSLTEITSKEHATTELARCVATTIGRWRFPPFDGAESSVTIPFYLKSAT